MEVSLKVVDDDDDVREEVEEKEGWCVGFWRRYLCEGQKLDRRLQDEVESGRVSVRYRKIIAVLIPFTIVHAVWWTCFIKYKSFHKFVNYSGKKERWIDKGLLGKEDTAPWYMSVTMIFGSMVAGMTSEGGASVAFPVMTLIFDIKPVVAKHFSFMIQSVGMTAAAFVIVFMRVQIEWKSVVYCTIGGVAGVIYGLEEVSPELTPPYAKMYFVVIWGSFAASLFFLNRIYGRKVYVVLDPPHLPNIWRSADLVANRWLALVLNWKALILIAAGFLGGIFTSIAGSGIDICSFSVLTLLFRISEKTATPTSVVLMAINTVVAMCYSKWGMREGLEGLAWEFFVVCAPIVVVGAPLGSVIGSYVHRLVLAAFIYITDTVQLAGALYVVRPWTHTKCHKRGGKNGPDCEPVHLCWSSAVIFVAGLITFYVLQFVGERLIQRNSRIELEAEEKPPWSDDGWAGVEADDAKDDHRRLGGGGVDADLVLLPLPPASSSNTDDDKGPGAF
ncbi:hypothetical protein CTAYLR_003710 [Chrysophaeum taylorii]|uniref:Uncharacterized protein n=1 Tax=Chrysophaeum taylorii TaxID=2483200 RepID=A0AAD7XTR4_9STRA|nr:hypothetical protein CTAYLR_003710 [Chrysophaeum taylorii]